MQSITTTTYTTKITQTSGKQTVIPNVIDAQLIVEAINQEQDKGYEGGIINTQNVVMQNLKELSLSFRNIMEIQNLKSLEKLQKLQLDNNLISKIQNIDHLVNLRWLDLSFNSIEVIEGLENLTELEDISLYDNRISQLSGLQNCLKLNVFSVGNNQIKSYDVITSYFGYNKQSQVLRFKKLQVLNIAGNPFKDNESSYRELIIAHCPGLKYLDYQFIDEADREKIRNEDDKIAQDTVKQEEYFQQMTKDNKSEQEEAQKKKEKSDSRMDLIDSLHKEFTSITEMEQIKPLKRDGIEGEIKKFSDKIVATVKGMQEEIIAKNKIRQKEFFEFEAAQSDRVQSSEKETITIIKEFEKIKKHSFRDNEKIKIKLEDLDQVQDRDRNDDRQKQRQALIDVSEEKLKMLLKLSDTLKDNLLGVEILLDEELRESFITFRTKQNTFIADFISVEITEKGQHKIEDSIGDLVTKLQEINKIENDKYSQNPINQDQNDELSEEEQDRIELLENKEQTSQLITQIKEALTDKAQEKLASLDQKISSDMKTYDDKRQLMMYERNRKNIQQIHQQIEAYQEEIRNELRETQAHFDQE